MVSIKEIAKEVGVSPATVSNALTGKGRVSSQMIDRIQAVAKELGYRPSLAGRALQRGQTGILGLVMPDLTNPLFPRIAQQLSIAADAQGLGILIGDSRGNPDEQSQALHRLVDRGVDGLLVVPQMGAFPEPQPVPTAIIHTASDPRNSVSGDHAGGGSLIARHIAGLGHKRVVILGGDRVSEVQQDRIAGMVQEFATSVETRVLWGEDELSDLITAVSDGATAVMTTSDLLALRVLSHLTRSGFSVPRDVSLTGYDDLPLAWAMHPALTTIAQDVPQIATRALEIVTSLINGNSAPSQGEMVPMRLVIRQSTSKPNPRQESNP
ncbi:LacI family DNA-binding transcriptional regulator [Roseibium algae]|uniref:LacI family DNA-binding transcriptional regulator n=1 Tax=Roseibium algae TaxID=3123038 RepID=A0ABU8TF69_9HYPH